MELDVDSLFRQLDQQLTKLETTEIENLQTLSELKAELALSKTWLEMLSEAVSEVLIDYEEDLKALYSRLETSEKRCLYYEKQLTLWKRIGIGSGALSIVLAGTLVLVLMK